MLRPVAPHSSDPKGLAGAAKPQLHLIPPVLNTETAKALACGAAKYGPWNWRENRDALIDGEDIDPESGAHHLGHVAAGCGIVLDARRQGTLIDNRPPQP